MRGAYLEDLSWPEAERWLAGDPLLLLPLGAAAKEHGPHLPLATDRITVDWLAAQLVGEFPLLVAPTVAYHHYPAFVDFPGSTTLAADTSRDLIVQICESLARHGMRRCYALNNGVSTLGPLRAAAELLAGGGVELRWLDLGALHRRFNAEFGAPEWSGHADEVETSLMLHIAAQCVDMARAVADGGEGPGPLRRERDLPGLYAPHGVVGDARRATAAKGARVAAAMLAQIRAELGDFGLVG